MSVCVILALAAVVVGAILVRHHGRNHTQSGGGSSTDPDSSSSNSSTAPTRCPYTRFLRLLGLKKRPSPNSLTSTNLLDNPLDAADKAVELILADLQANILTGHGRDFARMIFVKIDPVRVEAAKNWVAAFAKEYVTSALRQKQQRFMFRQAGLDGGQLCHVAIAASGYRKFGFAETSIPQGSDPFKRRGTPAYRNVFADGAKKRQPYLLDPQVSAWEAGYRDDIDLMILVANDDSSALKAFVEKLGTEVAQFGSVEAVETGETIHRSFQLKDGEHELGVEHFGFVDGRSQPLLLKNEIEAETNMGSKVWDASAPAKLVLVPDTLSNSANAYGSFLVFRKLEQNVRGFRRTMTDLGNSLGVPADLAGAMAVGRFEDGTPISTSGKSGIGPQNDFDFADDVSGLKCPFHAHIRKTNPRGEAVGPRPPLDKTVEAEKLRRIARRGIPYGGALTIDLPENELPEGGVGLLFFCYQADIQEQFEFIQRVWANNPFFLEPAKSGKQNSQYDTTGLDPVIGQKHPTSPSPAQPAHNWPSGWGKNVVKCPVDFAGFVSMKGGEYFFSPSITFLTSLSETK